MATHSSILAWRIPWTEGPGGLQSMGSKESDTTEVTARRQAKSPGVLGENMKVRTLRYVKEPGSLGAR